MFQKAFKCTFTDNCFIALEPLIQRERLIIKPTTSNQVIILVNFFYIPAFYDCVVDAI